MKRLKVPLCLQRLAHLSCLLIFVCNLSQAQPFKANFNLKLITGGAMLEGTLVSGRGDELISLTSSQGRSRLLRCSPRCVAVKRMPINKTLVLSQRSLYRVVIGGKYRAGQKISITFRFANGGVLQIAAKAGNKYKR